MPFAILLIGALLIVVAFNNSYSSLVTELEADVPGYFKWGAAIVAILALGYVPGLKTPSRWLLALVLVVLFLANYQGFYAQIQSLVSSGGGGSTVGQGQANPSASYVATYAPAAAGGATATASASMTAAQNLALNPLNPSAYTSMIGAL